MPLHRPLPTALPLSFRLLSPVRPLSFRCPRLPACLCYPSGSGRLLSAPSGDYPPFFFDPEAPAPAVDLLAQRVPLCPAVGRGGPPDERSGAARAGAALGVRCAPTGRRRHPAEGSAAEAAGRQGSCAPPRWASVLVQSFPFPLIGVPGSLRDQRRGSCRALAWSSPALCLGIVLSLALSPRSADYQGRAATHLVIAPASQVSPPVPSSGSAPLPPPLPWLPGHLPWRCCLFPRPPVLRPEGGIFPGVFCQFLGWDGAASLLLSPAPGPRVPSSVGPSPPPPLPATQSVVRSGWGAGWLVWLPAGQGGLHLKVGGIGHSSGYACCWQLPLFLARPCSCHPPGESSVGEASPRTREPPATSP